MNEPNRWNYLEFEQPAGGGTEGAAPWCNRSWFLEIDGQERIFTGPLGLEVRLLRRYLPEALARRYQAIPIELPRNGILRVAMADPDNLRLRRELERETNLKIQACRTTPEIVQQCLAMYHQGEPLPPPPLRLYQPTVLSPSPWVHAPFRRAPRRSWPSYRRMAIWVCGLVIVLLLMLPLFLGPLFLIQFPR